MRTILCFALILAAGAVVGQTPFIEYFGTAEPFEYFNGFTRQPNGDYLLHASISRAGERELDVMSFRYSAQGVLLDSVLLEEPLSQTLLFAEESTTGGAVLCGAAETETSVRDDIFLKYVDAQGNELFQLVFGGPFYDRPTHMASDEQDNVFVAYRSQTLEYQATFIDRLRRMNADRVTVYDMTLPSPTARILEVMPIGDGELLVVASDRSAAGEEWHVYRLSAAGEVQWERLLTTADQLTAVTQGFLSSDEFYLFDGIGKSVLRLDLLTGETLISRSLPTDLIGTRTATYAVYAEELWIMAGMRIYRLFADGAAYVLAQTYNNPNSGFVIKDRLRPSGEWEFFLHGNGITRLDLPTAQIALIVNHDRPETLVSTREENVAVLPAEDLFYVATVGTRDGERTPYLNTYSLSGELTGSVLPEAATSFSSATTALPDGGAAVVDLRQNELSYDIAWLRIYDATGTLETELELTGSDAVVLRQPVQLGYFQERLYVLVEQLERPTGPPRRLIYDISLEDPDGTPTQLSVMDAVTDQFSVLAEHEVGLLNLAFDDQDITARVRKINTDTGLEWEGATTFTATDHIREYFYSFTRHTLTAHPVTGDVLVGINTQADEQPPVYHLEVFDGDTGVNTLGFTAANTYESAAAEYLGEDRIVLVGCGRNPAITGLEDRYLLYYEIYDLAGNQLWQNVEPIPYRMHLYGLSVPPDGHVLAYGEVTRHHDRDGVLVLLDENGAISRVLASPSAAWGVLEAVPNPSSGPLRIRLDNAYRGELTIHLYHADGRQAAAWTARKDAELLTWEAELAQLPAGTYWVQVQSPEGQAAQAWIKSR